MGMMWLNGMALLMTICQGPLPATEEERFRDLLRELRQKAEATKTSERQQALDLFKQAEQAGKAGRWSDAQSLARQAEQIDPDLPGLRLFQKHIDQQLKTPAPLKTDLQMARLCLMEAVVHLQSLVQERRYAEAQRWSEMVRGTVHRFPKDYDLSAVLERMEEVIREFQQRLDQPPPPPIPASSKTKLPAPESDSTTWKKRLSKPMNIEWDQVTIREALQQIADATGVTFTIDEPRVSVRQLDQRTISLHQQTSANLALETILQSMALEFVPLSQNQLLLTTKAQALARAVRPESLQSNVTLQPSTQAKDPRSEPPPRTESPAPSGNVGQKPPAYLQSPEAFRRHMDALLGPELTQPPPPPPTVLPPPKDEVLPPPKADLPP